MGGHLSWTDPYLIEGYANGLRIRFFLEDAPFCLARAIAAGGRSGQDMDLVMNNAMRFVVVMGVACLVPHWRFSVWRVALVSAVVVLFAFVVVTALGIVEAVVLDGSRVKQAPGIQQAALFGRIADLRARFRVRRRPAPVTPPA